MIVDSKIEQYGSTVFTGPDINPVTPDSFVPQLASDGVHIYTAGKAFAGALAQIKPQLIPNLIASISKVSIVFTIFPDQCTIEQGQAIEHDLRITIGGLTYILDSQINLAEGGMLQLGTGATWVDTGIKLEIPVPYTWNTYVYSCSFDIKAKTSSFLTANGIAIPASLVTKPAQSLGWGDSVVFQNQRCLGAQGGAMSDISTIDLEWS